MNKASVFVADKKTPTPGELFYENLCNPKVVRENLKKAIEASWAAGVPVLQQDESGRYELYPNGKKIYIKVN